MTVIYDAPTMLDLSNAKNGVKKTQVRTPAKRPMVAPAIATGAWGLATYAAYKSGHPVVAVLCGLFGAGSAVRLAMGARDRM